MPTKHKYRFLSNWESIHWQGSKMLPKQGNHCLLTKSMKDVMLLYEFGIISIAPTSENIVISENQYKKIRIKYKNILLFYDNDLPGVKAAHKYKKKYDIRCIFIKRKYAKDISDLYKKVSSTVFWGILEELELIIQDNTITKTKHFYVF
jgi:DNA primase